MITEEYKPTNEVVTFPNPYTESGRSRRYQIHFKGGVEYIYKGGVWQPLSTFAGEYEYKGEQ